MFRIIQETDLNILIREIKFSPEYFVPVIGPELMIYNIDGKWISVYSLIARELAEELEIPITELPINFSIEEVLNVFHNREQDYTSTLPYYTIQNILNRKKWEIPDPVKYLAKITDFKFYINATWLPFISDALIEFHNKDVEIISNSIQEELNDFSNTHLNEKVKVYNLLGNAKESIKFGLLDDDILCMAHNMITNCPCNFKDIIQENKRKLCLFGCDFSNWLIRLIYYSIRGCKALEYDNKSIFFVTKSCSKDPSLYPLWNRLNTNLYVEAETFKIVQVFYEKWREQYVSKVVPLGNSKPFPKNSIFISYDRRDQKTAEKLYAILKDRKLPAWFDEEQLEDGEYKEIIKHNIKHCSVFVPVISSNSIDNVKKKKTMYELEWTLANDEYKSRLIATKQTGYIIPIIIDETDFQNPDLPKFISEKQSFKIDDEKFYSLLVDNIKKFQNSINQL
jgi:hypothetical protein